MILKMARSSDSKTTAMHQAGPAGATRQSPCTSQKGKKIEWMKNGARRD